jgi:two-component system response regulator (stage 0 sporulation protein F)
MLHILLIEDDAAVRGILSRMLEGAGYGVIQATNGADGLRLWREQGPDLVLTDIQMPDMNGIEVIVQLRAFAPHLPVIAMSGGVQSRDLDLLSDAKLLGAVGVLYKPFTGEALTQAITAALQHTQPRNE